MEIDTSLKTKETHNSDNNNNKISTNSRQQYLQRDIIIIDTKLYVYARVV